MINYAHRGASEYAPENTLSSFYLGLLQGANGIETDVQRTKDGVLVLFHDDTLDRVTDSTGRIQDYTLEELKKVKVFGNSPRGFYDRIPTFMEFLQAFSEYDIQFAIELKSTGTEQDVVDMIYEFGIKERTTVTSFRFECIRKVKEIDPGMRVGYLVKGDGCAYIDELQSIGGEEMAPKAGDITEESIDVLRNAGLGVRAWGVANQDLMRKMCVLKVDGMTVNFPDRLYERVVRNV